MRKSTREEKRKTIGLDLGDRFSHFCVIGLGGRVEEEERVATTIPAIRKVFGRRKPAVIALEAGTHSPWVSRLLSELGHEVLVGKERYPETELLRQVPGVGAIVALAFVLTLEDPERFEKSRSAGSFVGLVPRRDQSGNSDPQRRITKCGDELLRRLLVQAANHILGPFGKDTDLRRHGERIAARGGKNAKKRANVAVARKLSVLLHRLWRTGEVYEPLYAAKRKSRKAA